MEVLKVALTGGPCGGKTTSIQTIEQNFTEKGYHVIIVPEAATILINSGIRPFGDNGLPMFEFQRYVMRLQMQLEEHATLAASQIDAPTIIVCDRGLLDDKAYVTNSEFHQLLREFETTQFELLSRYDLVMHLTTAADGKEEYYTTSNNQARTETPAEARAKDKQTLAAWIGHDNLKIMGNETTFDVKIANTVQEIHKALATPYPIQSQEKYLVSTFDLTKLEELDPVVLDIEQYLVDTGLGDTLYRKSIREDEVKYTRIIKVDTEDDKERIITRKNITSDAYDSMLPEGETPIRKTRYCFAYRNQYFRLDVFDDGLQILEIEDTNKTAKRVIPPFIEVSSEVTDDPSYRNGTIYNKKNKKNKEKNKK